MAKEMAKSVDEIAKTAKAGTVPTRAQVTEWRGQCKGCHDLHRGGDASSGYTLKK
jgi:hypothetical protein